MTAKKDPNIVKINWRQSSNPVFNMQIYSQLPKDDALEYLRRSVYEYMNHLMLTGAMGITYVYNAMRIELFPVLPFTKEEFIKLFEGVAYIANTRINHTVERQCDFIIHDLQHMEEKRWLSLAKLLGPT